MKIFAAVCAIAGLCCLFVAHHLSPALVPYQVTGGAAVQPVIPAGSTLTKTPTRPVKIFVPALDMSSSLVELHTDASRHILMPPPDVAGWYRIAGPLVLIGHVDDRSGPAVFYRLSGMKRGEKVEISSSDGSKAEFEITKLTDINKNSFPSMQVYTGSNKEIRLITCVGPYSPKSGYSDSLIAWGKQI